MLSARRMREDSLRFKPEVQVDDRGNHKLKLRRVGKAIKARLHLIPFIVSIPEKEQDKDLPAKLLAERDGILAWMIEGLTEWRRIGLAPPKRVIEATAEYFEEQDTLGQWLAERCSVSPAYKDDAGNLYLSHGEWCEDHGLHVPSATDFGMQLTERGFGDVRATARCGAWGCGSACATTRRQAMDRRKSRPPSWLVPRGAAARRPLTRCAARAAVAGSPSSERVSERRRTDVPEGLGTHRVRPSGDDGDGLPAVLSGRSYHDFKADISHARRQPADCHHRHPMKYVPPHVSARRTGIDGTSPCRDGRCGARGVS